MEEDVFVRSFVPLAVAGRLERQSDSVLPDETTFEAAVVLADISGFTALAERLAERGAEGAELLAALLNDYFAAQVETIAAHGGAVTSFAGDAIIALWGTADATPLSLATAQAASCAQALHHLVAERALSSNEAIQLRIGLASGRVWAGRVGGVGGHWEHVLGGIPVVEAGRAAAAVQPGQIGATSPVPTLLGTGATWVHAPAGLARLKGLTVHANPSASAWSIPELSPDRLRSYVPRIVAERLDAAHAEWLAEFRRVTVAFLDLGELGEARIGILDRLQPAITVLQDTVAQYQGSVTQIMADDKGTAVVIGWNLPSQAREDAAARATLAAVRLVDRLRAIGMTPAIGVATGRAFCGLRGGAARREYAMVGAVVNRAARLMQAAPGRVFCDGPTVHAASTRLAYAPVGALQVKGIATLLDVYEPAGSAAASRSSGSTVGRSPEIARFGAALDQLARDAPSRVVVFEGEPGIGKSHLAAACLELAHRRDVATIRGAADAIEVTTPYYVWGGVFRELLDGGDAASIRADVLRRLGDDERARAWLPLISPLLSLGVEETDATRQMSADARAERTRELLLRILASVEPKPFVLALEDAHWFDSASWALAAALVRRLPGVLLLLTVRPLPGAQMADVTAVLQAAGEMRIRLEPLSSADVLEMLRQRLGVAEIPPTVAAFVHRKAGGNPFFSEQLVSALRDRSLLIVDGRRCRMAHGLQNLDRLEMPATLEGVITGRVDSLEPAPQLTLKVASVIGRAFRSSTLREIHPVFSSDADLDAQLRTLVERDLIRPQSAGADPEYLFTHAVLQDVVYGLMTFAQRRGLHRAMASWIERQHAGEIERHLGVLAHHWRETGDAQRAIGYLERAGEQAFENAVNEETIQLVRDAGTMADQHAIAIDAIRRGRWEWWLGFACIRLGRYHEADEHLRSGLSLLREFVPRNRGSLIVSLVAQTVRQVGGHLGRAAPAEDPRERERARLAASLYHRYLEMQYYLRGALWSLAGTLACLNVSERAGRSPELGITYCIAGYWVGQFGLRRLARRYYEAGEDMVEEGGHMSTIGYFHLAGATYSWTVAEWDRGRRHALRGLEAYQRAGDKARVETMFTSMASQAFYRGRYGEAQEWLDRLESSAWPYGAPPSRIWWAALQALIRSRRGEPAGAAAARLENELDDGIDATDRLVGLGGLALALLHDGRPGEARTVAEQALTLAREYPPVHLLAEFGLVGLADTLFDLYEKEPVATAHLTTRIAQVHGVLRSFARLTRSFRPVAQFYEGRRYRLLGDRRAARSLGRAAMAAERLDLGYDAARAHHELSRIESIDAARRAHHANRATALFDRIGVPRPASDTAVRG